MSNKLFRFLLANDLSLNDYGDNKYVLQNIHFFSLSFISLFLISGAMYFAMNMWSEGFFYSFLTVFNISLLFVIRSKYYKNVGLFASIFINMLFMFLGKVMGDESIIQVFLIVAIISTYYYTVRKTSMSKVFAFILVVGAYLIIELLIDDEHLSFLANMQMKGFIAFVFIAFGLLSNLFTYNFLNEINWVNPIQEEELFQIISQQIDYSKLGEDDSYIPEEMLNEDVDNEFALQELVTCAELHLKISFKGEESIEFLSEEIGYLFDVNIVDAQINPSLIWEKVVDQKKLLKNTFSENPTKKCVTTEFCVKKDDGAVIWLESVGIIEFIAGENFLHIHEMITEIRDPERIKENF